MSFGGATCKARGARATTSARAAGAQCKARAAKREKVEEPASPVDDEARAAEAPDIEMMEQQLDRYMGRGHYPIAPGSFGPRDFGFEDHVAERLGRWWLGKILLAPRWDARACCIVFLSAARRLLGADRRTSASGGAKCVNLALGGADSDLWTGKVGFRTSPPGPQSKPPGPQRKL